VTWKQIGRLLRTLFLLRVPLLTLIFLAAFAPLAIYVAKTLLGNLFDVRVFHDHLVLWQERTSWNLFVVSFSAFLAALTAVTVINLILHYGRDRYDDPALSLDQKRPLVTFFCGTAAALPLVITAALQTCGNIPESRPSGLTLGLMPVLGLLAALGLVFLAKVVQLVFTNPQTTRHPPPYLIFPVYKIRALENFFDRLYCYSGKSLDSFKGFINRMSQWPLEILRCAGQGYLIDCNATRGSLALRSGHVFGLALSIMAFATYLGIGLAKSKIDNRPAAVPALAYLLLFGIVVCWVLGALTFFLDRYRVPLLSGLAIVSLVTISAPQSDHVYRVEPRDKLERISPADLVRKHTAGGKRIILVATAGGGIQAAAWTTQVLRGLEEHCAELSPPSTTQPKCNFRDSVVLISGVSGGSLGAIAYTRSFTDYPSHVDSAAVPDNAAQPALDEVAWAWMNPDVGRAIMPWFRTQYVDRGWALEEKWAAVNQTYVPRPSWWRRLMSGDYGMETWLGDWAKQTQDHTMPALLLNATQADKGQPLVFSTTNFPLKDDSRGLNDFYGLYPGYDIRVTTAARLSASFPYVAPAARANKKPPTTGDTHVVDGGYYDNYGINSLLGWLENVITTSKGETATDVLILQIRPFAESAPVSPKPVGWGFQLVAPVDALLNVRDTGQSARGASELALFTKAYAPVCDDKHRNCTQPGKTRVWRADFFYPSGFTGTHTNCADTPLSWKLSYEQTKCIRTAWDQLVNDEPKKDKPPIGCLVGYLQGNPVANICKKGDDK